MLHEDIFVVNPKIAKNSAMKNCTKNPSIAGANVPRICFLLSRIVNGKSLILS
jgi:hypothetical protein